MKIQRYSSLDIFLLAIELNNVLTGKAIRQIVAKGSDIYLALDDRILRYHILTGSPYLVLADKLPSGRNWLSPIKGGLIEKVNQVALDRLIMFEIVTFTKLGKRKNFHLYFEFYKNGNILLTDNSDKVMSSMRRNFKSGQNYMISKPDGFSVAGFERNQPLAPENLDSVKSLNVFQYSKIIESNPADIAEFILESKSNPKPHIIKNKDNQVIGFASYGPPFIDGFIGEESDDLLEMMSEYVKSRIAAKTIRRPNFKKRLQKARKKLDAIENELSQAKEFVVMRRYGETILANLKSIKKGQTECLLADHLPGQNNMIKISLDPSISPEKNASVYFDKARKREKGLPIIEKRMDKQLAEINRLELLEKESAGDEDDLAVKDRGSRQARKRPPFKHYQLDDGWQVYLGKSAASNDELTFSFAKKDDLWFHAWQAFGSHLILRPPQKGAVPDKQIILKAASLAAYFSKAKNSSKVPVIYTEVRYLRKVRKVLGKAIYTNEKGLMVKPQSPKEILID
ncbi:MAG: DUF814 domain-containing protein [candidate division Zixibacteria bacterium]|nr:DUF814 domain-containing protein [candidate division Zixibacteria bacterium]